MRRRGLVSRAMIYLPWPYLLLPYLLWPKPILGEGLHDDVPTMALLLWPYLLWPYLLWPYLLVEGLHDDLQLRQSPHELEDPG